MFIILQNTLKFFRQTALKLERLKKSLGDFIAENCCNLQDLFDFNKKMQRISKINQHCNLYISNWEIDLEFVSKFKTLNGDLFIKPHPRIKNISSFEDVNLVSASIPVELLIKYLAEKYDTVNVFDHNSSVRRYISCKNIKFTKVESLR